MAKVVVVIVTGLWTMGSFLAQAVNKQQEERTAAILRYLEQQPDQSYIIPQDLEQLVGFAQAALVGRIIDFGDLVSLNDVGSRGKVIGTDVFASYRVSISEVLFNRKAEGPPLEAGATATITQNVDRRGVELFLSRKFPPLDGREYVLFLWLRPGGNSWSMLQWPLQFRRSVGVPNGAESAAPLPDGRFLLHREWLDPALPIISTDRGTYSPEWSALKDEVRRLAVAGRT